VDQRYLVFAVVVLPILCATVGFTVRYAIRPIMDSLIDALHELGRIAGPGESARRVARLEVEVHELQLEVRSLREGESPSSGVTEPHDALALPPV
jgi:hypothetical protein